jgi:hypothetical protein
MYDIIFYTLIFIFLFLFIIDYFLFKPYINNININYIKNLLKNNNIKLPKYINSKGIITTINNNDNILNIGLLILTLKSNNCVLPIYIYYNNIDIKYINFLKNLNNNNNIKFIDILKIVNDKCIDNIKLIYYSIIFSPINEIIYINPNILFFNNPEYLFNNSIYLNNGTIYWKNISKKTICNNYYIKNIKNLIPYQKSGNLILNNISDSYQSADIFLLNKSYHFKTLQYLYIFTQNWKFISKSIPYQELLWICNELANEKYDFINIENGLIGYLYIKKIYGDILYFDNNNNLLCFKLLNNNIEYNYYKIFDNINELEMDIKLIINNYKKMYHDLEYKFAKI